jgi:hypothetical protein
VSGKTSGETGQLQDQERFLAPPTSLGMTIEGGAPAEAFRMMEDGRSSAAPLRIKEEPGSRANQARWTRAIMSGM